MRIPCIDRKQRYLLARGIPPQSETFSMHRHTAALIAFAVVTPALAGGTTHTVTQVNLTFSPASVQAMPGDTIQWVWTGGSHAVEDGAACTSGGRFYGDLYSGAPTFSWTIPADEPAGTISYFCPVSAHCAFGMEGTIEVLPAGGGWSIGDVLINEIRIDQTGTDNDEYFELKGEPGLSLNGLTYLVIGDGTGGFGVIEEVTPLDGYVIGPNGFIVFCELTNTLVTPPDNVVVLNFENSDNVTHLLVSGFTGTDGQLLDTNQDRATCLTEVHPWDEIIATCYLRINPMPDAASTQDCYYGDVGAGPDGTFVPGHVYLCDDGHYEIGGFALGTNDTPGAANTPCTPPCVPADLNCDGSVNGADLTLVLSGWGAPEGDINGDGTTDGADLTLLLSAWTG